MIENSFLKAKTSGETIHERKIKLRTYRSDNDRIIVEGRLKDDSYERFYDVDGLIREPGTVHHMLIRILVGGPPLTILDAEAEMPYSPHDPCLETLFSIKKVIGLEIKGGFGERVHGLIGGVEGCAHLTHLLVTMSQEAVQGYWQSKMSEKPLDRDSFEKMNILPYIRNSCSLWRKDGPLTRDLEELLNKK